MDDWSDQYYDLRAVTVCNINNEEVENPSAVVSGIKDMYNPRLFGSAQPANGVLTVLDEIRLNFNEPIADGLMTKNNFQVTGVRHGSVTDHSTSVELDGSTSYMATEYTRNLLGKDLTFEVWINAADAQNATIFAHGNNSNSLELAITSDNHLQLKVGSTVITSEQAVPFDKGTWAHVAFVYEATGYISAYYNYTEYISSAYVGAYSGIGNFTLGCDINNENHFAGKMHTARLWDKVRTSGELQLNSLTQLSGSETGLIAYYPMKEGRGSVAEDKARGANMVMNACEWALPDGYAIELDGGSYVSLPMSAAVATASMNYTVEFWFKTDGPQYNAVMISNGRGDGTDLGGSENIFSVGFDEKGALYYANNGYKHEVEGNYADSQWHHFVMTVSRTTAFGQIYMDGILNTYFDAEQVGGIASSNAFIGACCWYEEDAASNLKVDNYFKGKIDEFRFWSLSKTQSIIESFSNEKLNGDEMGLLAYYPFETYITHLGVEMLEVSLKDHKQSEQPGVENEGVVVGNERFSTDKAPVKDKGPVSNLSFEFVVNDDALIIELTESPSKIDKTIVTFTAMDITDKNGNKILSPITWSAYINRNQLKWGENILNIEKKEYEPYEFTVNVVNESGSVQNYEISNQPSWLEISSDQGDIDPVSSEPITFTIAEGLNVGTYNEVIYLTGSDGVSEALELNVTVTGDEPDWNVNPADYLYNMSVYGKLRFNNVFSSDERDKIAVFRNGICIGAANCMYSKEMDMWYVMLTVYGNELVFDGLSFRMWDASTGVIYDAVPAQTITFKNDAIYGTPWEPIVFDGNAVRYQRIALEEGWNWISFNLKNNDLSNVNTILANGEWTNEDVVKTMDRFDSYSATSKKWVGTLSSKNGFDNLNMYWMKVSVPQELAVSGAPVDPTTTPITIAANVWTPISYLPQTNLPVKTALAGYDAAEGDVVKTKDGFAMFYRNNWIGSISYMEVNKGYMLRNTSGSAKTLVYPSAAASAVNGSSRSSALLPAASAYSDNMNIIAVCDEFEPEDKLYAVVGEERRSIGSNVDIDGRSHLFITVPGEDSNNREFVGFVLEKADGEEIEATTILPYHTNALLGSIDSPVQISFESSMVEVYPIPFKDYLTVSATASQDAAMRVEVTDMTGALIYKSGSQQVGMGDSYIHTIKTELFASGVYIISIYENDSVTIRKAVK